MSDLDFPTEHALNLVERAFAEDLGPDGIDVTTMATIPPEQERAAVIVARESGVVAGVPVIDLCLRHVSELTGLPVPAVDVEHGDGVRVSRGDVIARVTGRTQAILIAERTILNIMSRLSGVATHTRRWADELEGTGAMVLDTRKTTPGMRWLEKYAVRCGGGTNKRMGLYDVAMIKDNHKLAAGSVSAAYSLVRKAFPEVDIQVEVTTGDEAREAFEAGARFVMCDNMDVTVLRETVSLLRRLGEQTGQRVEIEATGGLRLEVVREYAETGVDFLSVGALTHSSPIIDIALDLDLDPTPPPDPRREAPKPPSRGP